MRRKLSLTGKRIPFTAALLTAGVLTSVRAQVQNAGTLFVNVDATALPEGSLASVPNTGTLGGVFAVSETDNTPRVATVGGTKGIQLDGNDYLEHLDAVGGSPVFAPAELVGEDPTRSIEVWALNPSLDGEETLVSWGKRGGGPDGSNMSFNYGSDFRWGAVGHWGNRDIGWNNQGGGPAAGKWHHLVYTYDGNTTRLYVDGAFQNGEYLGPGAIVTHPDTATLIGAQREADGTTVTTGLRFNGTIARVRVHDGVLTAEQVQNNYNVEKAAFVDPVVPPPPSVAPERLTKAPAHRYSFNEAAGDATAKTFADTVGGADGNILGEGATFSGSRLVLPGGSSATAAYGDLPNGLVSSNGVAKGGSGGFTVEIFARFTGSQNWSRAFDFGSSFAGDENGEVFDVGGAGNGQDYFMLSAQIGGDVNNRRFEIREADNVGDESELADIATRTFNTDTHLVATWDEASGACILYENGERIGAFTADTPISDLNDVNVWLGRSQWMADANTQVEYDEVRLYDRVLTAGEVKGNFQAGANNLNNADTAVTVTSQPANVTVDETGSATFRVSAAGSSPVSIQWLRNGTEIPGATNATLTINNAAASDSGASFTARVSNTVNGAPVTVTSQAATLTVQSPLPAVLKHRYSFNETAGTTVADSVGGKNGELIGGGTFADGQLQLDGETGYVNLPNGLITALGPDATFELWITQVNPAIWARIFDIGTSAEGEDLTGTGTDYLFLTPRMGDGFPRFEANFPDGGVITVLDPAPPAWLPGNQETHFAITWSASGNTARLYINGVLAATATAGKPLSAFNNTDVNVWLGKSQFNDPLWGGKFNEFRIYTGAMPPSQVQSSFAAGPNGTATELPSLSVSVNGQNLVINWPASAGFVLESTTALGPGATWTAVNGVTGNTASVPLQGNAQFFRLRKP